MPKMRNRNAGGDNRGISDYLICGKRHNQPRIHHRICEEACRKTKRCLYYKTWYAENHEEEVKQVKEEKKKPRKKKIKKVSKRIRKIKTKEA
jgi:hypothetical protein